MSDRVLVLVLVLPQVNLLDLGGPAQVFDAAAALGGDYRLEFVAEMPTVRSAQGLALAELKPLPEVAPGELVLIPGPPLTAAPDDPGHAGDGDRRRGRSAAHARQADQAFCRFLTIDPYLCCSTGRVFSSSGRGLLATF